MKTMIIATMKAIIVNKNNHNNNDNDNVYNQDFFISCIAG